MIHRRLRLAALVSSMISIVVAACGGGDDSANEAGDGGGSSSDASSASDGTLTGDGSSARDSGFVQDAGDAGDSAARAPGGESIPGDASTTTITLSDAVIVSGAQRFGISLDDDDYSAPIAKNFVRNGGFEPTLVNAVLLAGSGATNGTFKATLTGGLPSTLQNPTYEIVSGVAKGQTGSISSYSIATPPTESTFTLGAGSTPLATGDAMILHASAPSSLVGTGVSIDTTVAKDGTQSAKLSGAVATLTYVFDSAWDLETPLGGDLSTSRLIRFEGNWQVSFWAKTPSGTTSLNVTVSRGPATLFSSSVAATTTWTLFTLPINVPAGGDPATAPTGSDYGALLLNLQTTSGGGTVNVDDLDFRNTDESTGSTVYSDAYVNRLKELQPGILQTKTSSGRGETLDNMLADAVVREGVVYGSNNPSWNEGLHEQLTLAQQVGADPYILIPASFSPADLTGLVEYLAAPATAANPRAMRRAALGQTDPWTSVFGKIHLEYGFESWNDSLYGVDFASLPQQVAVTNDRLAILKTSVFFDATKLDLVIGTAPYYPPYEAVQEAGTIGLEVYSTPTLAETFAPDAATRYLPFFGGPADDLSSGNLGQLRGLLGDAGIVKDLTLEQSNFSNLSTSDLDSGLAADPIYTGLGSGLVLPLRMLTYLEQASMRVQCAYASSGYMLPYSGEGRAHLYGLLRDVWDTNRKRPAWLGLEAVNHAIMGDLLTTAASGDTTTFASSGTPSQNVPFVQSFYFGNGTHHGLVVMNLDPNFARGVELLLPTLPALTATEYVLDATDLDTTNESAENVTLQMKTLTDMSNVYTLDLSPHSLRVLVWNDD